jgi:type IV pilus assembly protein PilY1
MTGTWSYFPGWDGKTASTPTYGWPAGCSLVDSPISNHVQELGARNPSAPPWEGPLVPFATDDSTTALRAVNDRIRYAMYAARPYGATPIAPMLADAQHYLWNDPNGPKIDPLGTCRGNFIILITDGFPNSDLRPNCEDNADPKAASVYPGCNTTTGGGGCCPTKRAQDIAYELAHPPSGKPPIKTFVVGFGLSDDKGDPIDCSVVDPTSGACSSSTLDPKYKPCCTLHEIAYNGDPPSTSTSADPKPPARAVLANDVDTLRKALLAAMAEATKTTSTSRTLPVFTMASNASGGQYEFRSSFRVNAFSSWSGVLERVRWECKSTSGILRAEPVLPIVPSQGDDFSINLNKQATRTFYTWDASTTGVKAGDTLRPNLSSSDSDGILTAVPSLVVGDNSTFVTGVPSSNLQLTTASCTDASSIDECKAKFLNYALALPQPKTTWQSRVGNAMGDIYHATPVHVGPPSNFLRDESYTTFRNAQATRTPIMLTATNDGLLHAFDATVKSDTDPVEVWGFIPPAVLPHIAKQYGGAHALLLDAAPVVKDVAFGQLTSTTPYGRTRNDARGGTARWRTIAVGGLTTGRGYYAVDVTDIKNPQLLWQLTKYKESTSPTAPEYDLFGTYPGTPAIGTVYYSDTSGGTPIETPVAFLPGGEGTLSKTGTCGRWTTPSDGVTRKEVRCWTGPGNTFTIVRLWDGKVIRTFRNDPGGDTNHPPEPNSATYAWSKTKPALVTDASGRYANIDSPITGTVALYPAAEGSVTTRAFVGDYDGTLWKLDVSDPNPQKWTFDIFHDAYHTADAANAVPSKWGPIAIAPVLSVDRFGDIVVDYATGDQNNFSTTNLNHVYAITERTTVSSSGSKALVPTLNWHLKLSDGVTPTGPMSLFSGNLFFSTFTPDVTSADACLRGQGTLWGVDYVEKEPTLTNDDGTPLPLGRHKQSPTATTDESTGTCPAKIPNANTVTSSGGSGTPPPPDFRCINLPAGSIVFGAGITQRPSCVSTPSSAIGIDPYMGGTSSHSTINDISVGEFQLVAQTGPKSGTSSGSDTKTNTYVRTLVPPLSSTRIDSWAAIIE